MNNNQTNNCLHRQQCRKQLHAYLMCVESPRSGLYSTVSAMMAIALGSQGSHILFGHQSCLMFCSSLSQQRNSLSFSYLGTEWASLTFLIQNLLAYQDCIKAIKGQELRDRGVDILRLPIKC